MDKKELECVDLAHSRGGRELFSGLSFSLCEGEVMLVRGKNGSGKSTLLRLMAGLCRPDAGSLKFCGTPIDRVEGYGSQLVYIGHKKAIKPALNASEMLRFWGAFYGAPELVGAALHYFELERFSDAPCRTLSAGWQQRLSLCRLILHPASLWLLDEPASHLDDDGIALLESLIAARKEQGGMIAIAMHGKVESKGIKSIEIK